MVGELVGEILSNQSNQRTLEGNTSTHQHISKSTNQHISKSTHQQINKSTHQQINTSTSHYK